MFFKKNEKNIILEEINLLKDQIKRESNTILTLQEIISNKTEELHKNIACISINLSDIIKQLGKIIFFSSNLEEKNNKKLEEILSSINFLKQLIKDKEVKEIKKEENPSKSSLKEEIVKFLDSRKEKEISLPIIFKELTRKRKSNSSPFKNKELSTALWLLKREGKVENPSRGIWKIKE